MICPGAYPLGGIATWLDYLCVGLQEKDWRVVVGLASGRWHDTKKYEQRHEGLTVTRVVNETGSREGRVRAIEAVIKSVNPQLVVGVNIPDCYVAAARCRGTGRWPKIVMTIHAIQPDVYDDATKHAALLDGVVCTNKLACELVRVDSGVNRKRIFYAPYGVADQEITYGNKGLRDPFRLAYVGRLEQGQKSLHDLPQVLDHLEGAGVKYQLIVAGTGPEETWIRRELSARAKKGIIEFLGEIELHAMNERVYDRADALIVTSVWETGPIIIWEAMASGVPVVTSKYIGSGLENSLINNENCLTFPTGDVREAAACITRLMDANLRGKLIQGGYRVVHNKYTQSSSIDAWDRCFTNIMISPDNGREIGHAYSVSHNGRLDRIFGVRLGETIRRALGRQYVHQSAGSEWPHSYGTRNLHDSSFWSLARQLDDAVT